MPTDDAALLNAYRPVMQYDSHESMLRSGAQVEGSPVPDHKDTKGPRVRPDVVAVDASEAAAQGATQIVVSARPAGSAEPAVSRRFTLAHNRAGTVTLPLPAAGAHDVHAVAVASDGSSSKTATTG